MLQSSRYHLLLT